MGNIFINPTNGKSHKSEIDDLERQINRLKLSEKPKNKSYDTVVHKNHNNDEILKAKHKIYGTDDKGRTLYQGTQGGIYRLTGSGNKVYVKIKR